MDLAYQTENVMFRKENLLKLKYIHPMENGRTK